MKHTKLIMIGAVLFIISGCYTQFYKPGMERQAGAYDKLYNRNDSTAIDTTLTRDSLASSDSYPNNEDRWYYWGRPRGYTNWGFDFNNYSPGYYWTYEGYYDYYGTPWWNNNYNNPWWNPYYGNGGGGAPAEPPSQREHGRRESDGGGSYANPQSPPPNSYASPPPPPPAPPKKDSGSDAKKQEQSGSDSNKRDGRRGR